MTKPAVMIFHDQRPVAMEQLERDYSLLRYDQAADKETFLNEYGLTCRAAATTGHVPVTRAMLEAMPMLELVASCSAGYEGFGAAVLVQHGVRLTNSSPVLCDDVADAAIMSMLAARRSLIAADAYVRSGE